MSVDFPVLVTSKRELERAIAASSEIIVEGDDQLIVYAERLAYARSVRRRSAGGSNLLIVLVAVVAIVLVVACVAWFATSRVSALSGATADAAAHSSELQGMNPGEGGSTGRLERIGTPRYQPSVDWVALVRDLTWPVVVICGLGLVFLITRQALSQDRNVEVSWTVTEKVAGRIVISRTRGKSVQVGAAR